MAANFPILILFLIWWESENDDLWGGGGFNMRHMLTKYNIREYFTEKIEEEQKHLMTCAQIGERLIN